MVETNEQITAMTFNVGGTEKGKGTPNDWEHRRRLSAKVVLDHTPQVIGLQEAAHGNIDALYMQHLRGETDIRPYGEILGPDMDYGYFNPIFWQTEHFSVEQSMGFYLHPDKIPEVASDWNARNIRCANVVVFTENDSSNKVCIVNTHLDHIGERARVEGARLILQKLDAYNLNDIPTIVMGDFNAGHSIPPGSETVTPHPDKAIELFELFGQAGFVDVYGQLYGDGPQSNTYHGFLGRSYDPSKDYGLWRIDYIMARGLAPVKAEIDKYAEPPVYPSDHYPVIATVQRQ